MATTAELKQVRLGTIERGMQQARELLGKRIEIPVHYDMWMRGAFVRVKMDHPSVRRLLKLWRIDYDYANTISEFRAAVRVGPYAWPGGYPLHFICDDGGILCCKCVKTERRNILESIARGTRVPRDDWRVVGQDVNWEDTHMECEHCGKRIESAYGED